MTRATETRRAGGAAGSGDAVCFGGERNFQAQNLVRRFGARPPLLHLVPLAPPPRPRRFAVRISALDGRCLYGRSRAFHLTHDDVDELIAVATRITRMERRRAP